MATRKKAAKKSARRNPAGGPTSERDAWESVKLIAREIRDADKLTTQQMQKRAQYIAAIADTMLQQLRDGLHKNPPLTVFSLMNPPTRGAQLMSDHLYTIEYKHKGNGKNYFHDFKKGTEMLALPNGTVLIRRPGAKVWGDYPPE